MDEIQDIVYVDDEIASPLLRIVGEAKQEVVLVSPYWDTWGHLRSAISRAVSRGIKVTALVRNDDEGLGGKNGQEAIAWLLENGVAVLAVERLHAKIYMNEQTVLVSSMNLTESSAMNSHEVSVLLGDTRAAAKVRAYVRDRLLAIASPVTTDGPSTEPDQAITGYCIRCGTGLDYYDPSKPLCDECYEEWAEWENEEYEEEFCHSCGRREQTSYAKPLCINCFRKQK